MNREETIVAKFLVSKGYRNIQYEPDGSIPPDFLVNNKIAIEVRRLNKHFKQRGTKIPIEELEFGLIRKVRRKIESYKVYNYRNSTVISLHYSRPLIETKELLADLEVILKRNAIDTNEVRWENVNENLSLKFSPYDGDLGSYYHVGFDHDLDSGGLAVANIYENLDFVIKEKEEKVKHYLDKYQEWWLVLVDYISYTIDNHDMQQLKSLPKPKYLFNKIFIIPPMSPEHGLEY